MLRVNRRSIRPGLKQPRLEPLSLGSIQSDHKFTFIGILNYQQRTVALCSRAARTLSRSGRGCISQQTGSRHGGFPAGHVR